MYGRGSRRRERQGLEQVLKHYQVHDFSMDQIIGIALID
jgi:hypothetical protein